MKVETFEQFRAREMAEFAKAQADPQAWIKDKLKEYEDSEPGKGRRKFWAKMAAENPFKSAEEILALSAETQAWVADFDRNYPEFLEESKASESPQRLNSAVSESENP